MVSRKDISKNHRTVIPVARDRLGGLIKNLAQSKLKVAFLQYDECTGLVVVHAKQPISQGQLFASTQQKWLPIRGSFVNLKSYKGTSENCHLTTFSVDRFKDSNESVNPQNQLCRNTVTGDSVWLDTVSKLKAEIEDLRSIVLRLDSHRASEQPITLESKTEYHELSSNIDYVNDTAHSLVSCIRINNCEKVTRCISPRCDNGQEASACSSVPSSFLFGSPDPISPPSGFRLAQNSEIRCGKSLLRASVLYWWPGEGWVQGTVRRISRHSRFSHVVGYSRSSPLGAAVVDTQLDTASHGVRWALLLPIRL
jgi:hypothetical protein